MARFAQHQVTPAIIKAIQKYWDLDADDSRKFAVDLTTMSNGALRSEWDISANDRVIDTTRKEVHTILGEAALTQIDYAWELKPGMVFGFGARLCGYRKSPVG